MKATWRTIGKISMVLIALGLICVLVGFFTGGSLARVQSTMNANYDVNSYIGIGKKFFADVTQGIQWLIAQANALMK